MSTTHVKLTLALVLERARAQSYPLLSHQEGQLPVIPLPQLGMQMTEQTNGMEVGESVSLSPCQESWFCPFSGSGA